MSVMAYLCELAWLPPGEVAADVVIEVAGGRITHVAPAGAAQADLDSPSGAERLPGLVLPGMADAHSHAFHRALRGRTHGERGTFWTWRDQMYTLAERLDPDRYLDLARVAFAEGVLAGFTTVGEFHYVHHQPDGTPYADPNVMGEAMVAAAREAGVRVTLLDTCYLAAGIGRPLEGTARRFGDGTAAAWAERADAIADRYLDASDVVVGAAIHSVRAVPREDLPVVADWAHRRRVPLHAHVSEQPAENEACLAAHGRTPTALLHEAGAVDERTTAVHATHLDDPAVAVLGAAGATVCLCPTTERDLADGIGPARRLADAGVRLAFGSDSRAVVDPFEEARAAELDLRLATLERGHLDGTALLHALTVDGQASLGFADAGRLQVGARADLVAVRLDSVRTAGAIATTALDAVVFGGGAADVTDVVVDGRRVVRDGEHVRLGDVGRRLADAIAAVSHGA